MSKEGPFMIDVFEVAKVDIVADNRWRVDGRCLETLKLGDIVFSAVGRKYKFIREGDEIRNELIQPQHMLTFPFTIVSIVSYNHQLEDLSGGMTGYVILEGTEGSALKDTNYLVLL